MKTSDYFGSSRSRYASAAVLAFALTLGLAPRAVRATCTPTVPCVGDCDGNGTVTVDEVLKMVNIALGNTAVATCTAGDGNCDNAITVDEILTAVNAALSGCAPPPVACGNGVVDAGEECDTGGYCIGGAKASQQCTSEEFCGLSELGVCIGGLKREVACANDAACGDGGKCVHCVPAGNSPFGTTGQTCAANCTIETKIHTTLASTSNAVLYSELLGGTLALSLSGSQDILVGKERNGEIPLATIATSVHFDPINVGTIACACVRGVPVKTCGGTLTEADGVTSALDCSDQYTAGNSVCTSAGKPPCAFVNGPGNAASGVIGCSGLTGVNLVFSQDSKGSAAPLPLSGNDPSICDPLGADFNPPVPPYPVCGAPPVITLSGSGGPGSAVVINTTAIGQYVGGDCSAAPANFCTDAAPISDRGTPQTLPTVSGQAAGFITNANQTDGDTLCNCNGGAIACAPVDCAGGSPQAGPIAINGSTVSCSQVASGSLSGLGLAGTFTQLSSANTGDIVVTNLQKIQ
jgi:hypothetical protein